MTPPAPALQTAEAEGRTAVQLAAPFRDQPELPRVYVDRRVDLDLSAAGGFVLEAEADPPETLARVSLYFHSRDGWYSAGGRATKPGWQRLRFAKSAFGTEESPAGWDKIDSIRIAFWRGSEPASANAVIRLRRLAAVQQDLALVVPGAAGEPDDAELRSARSISEDFEGMLTSLGLEADTIDEATVAATQGRVLGKRPVAILAYNPRLSDEAAGALAKYVEAGGKLLVCYQLHPSLATALGFSRGEYVRPERSGQLAEIRFQADDVAGLPPSVRQASWNITTAQPVCPSRPGDRLVVRRCRPADQLAGHAAERSRRVLQPCLSHRRLRPEDAVGGGGPGPHGRAAVAADRRDSRCSGPRPSGIAPTWPS